MAAWATAGSGALAGFFGSFVTAFFGRLAETGAALLATRLATAAFFFTTGAFDADADQVAILDDIGPLDADHRQRPAVRRGAR